MKPFKSASLAVVSAILILGATGSARPRYGGVLRVQTQGVLRTVDPASRPASSTDRAAQRHLLPLVFESLADVGADGGLQPSLAASWESDTSGAQWRVRLRPAVTLHNGSALTPEHVASSLAASRSDWQVTVNGGTILITPSQALPDLPWDLADSRTAIAVRTVSGELLGTGPFRVESLTGTRLTLRAHDGHRFGRPFLDAVQIDMGRAPGSQLSDLEIGRADLVTVSPADAGRVTERRLRLQTSRPIELFALMFEAHRAMPAGESIRRTFAAAIDRAAISRVLLQGQAQPAEALLPTWLSGYPPFVVTTPVATLSRQAVAALPAAARSMILRVDASDALGRAMAERVAVDAREAGFAVTVQAPAGLAARPDIRLERFTLDASAPDRTLASLFSAFPPRTLGLLTREAAPSPGSPLPIVSRIEQALLANAVLVPLVHTPELYALGARVDLSGAMVRPTGALDLSNVWLEPDGAAR